MGLISRVSSRTYRQFFPSVPQNPKNLDSPKSKMAKDDVKAQITKSGPAEPAAKKQKLTEEVDDAAFETAMTGIEDTEAKINTLEDECSIEICKTEQKFVEKKIPLFAERNQHIKKIPNFWSTALLNHPILASFVSDEDEEALQFLTNVEVDLKTREEEDTTPEGHKFIKSLNHSIVFEFSENPYFENKKLVKSFYQVLEDVVSEGSEIKWKAGKNLVENAQKEKAEVSKEEADTEEEGEQMYSFFSWFNYHFDPNEDEISEAIKEDIWMRTVDYFLGNVMEEVPDEEEAAAEE